MEIEKIQVGKLYMNSIWSKQKDVPVRILSKTDSEIRYRIELPDENGDGYTSHMNRVECENYLYRKNGEDYSTMTPTPQEQKAEELIERFIQYTEFNIEYGHSENKSIHCAIIHIDLMIEELEKQWPINSSTLEVDPIEESLIEYRRIKQYLLNKLN